VIGFEQRSEHENNLCQNDIAVSQKEKMEKRKETIFFLRISYNVNGNVQFLELIIADNKDRVFK
jgi:hypothetical protein